ncbi:MAG: hypothetical protein Q8L85_03945 [Alphaproteobacteria bacterium]|nr:hypothetical protein [Alphaproteobacteria bacterium]
MFKKSILLSCAVLIITNVHANPKCEELWNQYISLEETIRPHQNDLMNNITDKTIEQKVDDYNNAKIYVLDQTKLLSDEVKKENCLEYFKDKLLPEYEKHKKDYEEKTKNEENDELKKILETSLSIINETLETLEMSGESSAKIVGAVEEDIP